MDSQKLKSAISALNGFGPVSHIAIWTSYHLEGGQQLVSFKAGERITLSPLLGRYTALVNQGVVVGVVDGHAGDLETFKCLQKGGVIE